MNDPLHQDPHLPPEPEHDEQLSQARDRANVEVEVVHSAILAEGTTELERASSALAWSGVAAGLSMSASFFVEAQLVSLLPDVSWRTGVASVGYSVGFLLVILGRQQLFTENTLTVILPLMRQRSLATLLSVSRVWGVVLAANLAAGVAMAWVMHATPALGEGVKQTMAEMGRAACVRRLRHDGPGSGAGGLVLREQHVHRRRLRHRLDARMDGPEPARLHGHGRLAPGSPRPRPSRPSPAPPEPERRSRGRGPGARRFAAARWAVRVGACALRGPPARPARVDTEP